MGYEWNKNNPEKIKIIRKRYRERNLEKVKLREKNYKIKNKDKIKKQRREYYLKNKERELENCKKWKENNKERYKKNFNRWYKLNKERIKNKDLKKWNARKYTNNRIKKFPSEICEVCNIKQAKHKHHLNYNEPMKIKFVCIKCHNGIHKKQIYFS